MNRTITLLCIGLLILPGWTAWCQQAIAEAPAMQTRMKQIFDPPSLKTWTATGNISAAEAEKLRELVDKSEFEQAVRFGLSLPDVSLARQTALFLAWFSWSCANRDEAWRHWQDLPEAHCVAAMDGLMQGAAFSPAPDLFLWLKEARKSPDENLREKLLSIAGVMALISGELEPAQFLQLSSRAPGWWHTPSELSRNLDQWETLCAEKIREGRLERAAAVEQMTRLRNALDQQIAHDDSSVQVPDRNFSLQWGHAAGTLEGILPALDRYLLPGGEDQRREFLTGLGSALAEEEDAGKLAALAGTDPPAGEILSRAYVTEIFTHGFRQGLARFSEVKLPENLVSIAAGIAIPFLRFDRGHAEIPPEILAMPPGALKKQLLLQAGNQLEQDGDTEGAERWRKAAAEGEK